MKVTSSQAKNFFKHVIKVLKTRSKNFNYSIKSEISKPCLSTIRTQLKDIADNVAVNKMELDFLKSNNSEMYNQFKDNLDEIKNFENTLSNSLSKINKSLHMDEQKPRRSLILNMKRNVSDLNKHVDHIIKVRTLKARRAYSKLDAIEKLLLEISHKYNEILAESGTRKKRHAYIEQKMHQHLSNEHLVMEKLKDKLVLLEKLYIKAQINGENKIKLTRIKTKINLLKNKLND